MTVKLILRQAGQASLCDWPKNLNSSDVCCFLIPRDNIIKILRKKFTRYGRKLSPEKTGKFSREKWENAQSFTIVVTKIVRKLHT